MVQGCRGAGVQGFRGAQVTRLRDTEVQKCKDADMQKCRNAQMHRCRGAEEVRDNRNCFIVGPRISIFPGNRYCSSLKVWICRKIIRRNT